MARHVVPNYPYVQARNVGASQKPTAIFLHLAGTTSDKGSALGIANYHHGVTAPHKSYHYIVDEEQTFRCVPLDVASYGCPYRAINILICAEPQEDASMWGYGPTAKLVNRTAGLVADLMLAYRIPARNLKGDAELHWFNHRWRRRGGLMWHGLGAWPYDSFLADVKAQMVIKNK